ncbi:hypothetical protein [Corynebacterium comes]|uniref:Uncharacterized protein n=1 Tax=Corynebacterium comes TaxID=2675218 RepID=A0A6B8WCG0_9CORY|nr:hypothetical protein [Corynebacterium comes]QGU04498.1 hypothetical protein CETAM_06160 [Corynebacterium comes]
MTPQNPETSSFPAQPEYHPGAQPPQSQRSGLALLLLALLVLGAVVLGVWMYNALLRGEPQQEAQVERSTVPVTTTSAVPVTTVTSTVAPTTTSTVSTAPPEPAYRAPDSAVQCAANVNWRIFRANDQTSCGLAEAVAVEMAAYSGERGSALITARSPVTGQNYEMACTGQGGNSFVCEGGDKAVVVLEARSVRD